MDTTNINGIVGVGLTWDFGTKEATVPLLMRPKDLRSTTRVFIELGWADDLQKYHGNLHQDTHGIMAITISSRSRFDWFPLLHSMFFVRLGGRKSDEWYQTRVH